MSVLDNIKNRLNEIFNLNKFNSDFLQYHHKGSCKEPCVDCPAKDKRIFENNKDKPKVGWDNHPHCDCYYSEIEEKLAGSISNKGIYAPDVYLKAWGKLPDYYITKEEAKAKGWDASKNTVAGKCPGKMIGGNIYYNDELILPVNAGRIWYECDVDYEFGSRGTCSRLYYSSDGLMFYSDHFKGTVIRII